jgi:YgiT-type zinc finger domain-containing protein
MKCIVCKQAETVPGHQSLLLERGETTYVVKNVPARICPICSEAYMDEKVTLRLLRHAGQLLRQGARVDVREYDSLPGGE